MCRAISRRELFGGAQASPLRITEACIVEAGVFCQTCGDACPEAAIRFRLRLGAPPRPRVDFELCTACGECAEACPAAAIEMHTSEEAADA